MSRRGFTLIEMLVTLTIAAILVNIAIPALDAMKRKADAAHVIGDITTIRVAALSHYADLQSFPATAAWATPPLTMVPLLPQGFEFRYKSAQYRWHRWSLPNGMPASPGQTMLIGVEVQTSDQKLMAAIKGIYRGAVAFGSPTQVTFILE